ncbi:MAG: MBL fold metallo-hydrolase [Candidatus Thermoplasmatota archaeon]
MKLTVIYDNEVFKQNLNLRSDWRFACFIETKNNENILFDTGVKGRILLKNMEILDIDPQTIDKIIISHQHWDHKGGLKTILPLVGKAKIYRLEDDKKTEITTYVVTKTQKIAEVIYITGRLQGKPVDEQSLVLKGKKVDMSWLVALIRV